MNIEITQEIREKIKALYYGQNVLRYKPTYGSYKIRECKPPFTGHLYLKALSDITDEDAIEVFKIQEYRDRKFKDISFDDDKGTLCVCIETDEDEYGVFEAVYSNGVDYLRSKGYALPAHGFTVQELIDAGVYKIKSKE